MPQRTNPSPSVPLLLAALAALVPTAAQAQFTTETKLTASDADASDFFGDAVSISGEVAIVGASWNDDDGTNSGSAYIFERDQGGANNWGEVTKLTASDADASDFFGDAVSISGEVAIVGAWDNDDDDGSAYVFERNQGGAGAWGELAKLTASDAAGGDGFGTSVSISGDTAIVGGQYNDDDGTNSGSAYVFERNHGGANAWGEVIKLTASDAAALDAFGYSVSISGDVAIVGADRNDDDGSLSGSAYVFERNHDGANAWGEVAKLTASDADASDFFGWSVAISGETAIVGAGGNDDDGSRSGSAYIFERNQGGAGAWGEAMKLTASDAAEGDVFGYSVSISGEVALVGAGGNDDDGSRSGSAYIFDRNQGGANRWGELLKLTASDAAGGDGFGASVSISGDTAIVGGQYNDDDGSASGSAYIYTPEPGSLTLVLAGLALLIAAPRPAWLAQERRS